jgi:hypothetical protein
MLWIILIIVYCLCLFINLLDRNYKTNYNILIIILILCMKKGKQWNAVNYKSQQHEV